MGHPRLHIEEVNNRQDDVRQQIVRRYYQPYRAQVEHLVRQIIADHGVVIHLSSHSFTSELDGHVRNADIGLLYDPARPGEMALCEHWKADLKTCAPELKVRRNYPYAGKGDGLTTWFRRRLSPNAYIGIELEINQKHIIRRGLHWTALRNVIVVSLVKALAIRQAEISA